MFESSCFDSPAYLCSPMAKTRRRRSHQQASRHHCWRDRPWQSRGDTLCKGYRGAMFAQKRNTGRAKARSNRRPGSGTGRRQGWWKPKDHGSGFARWDAHDLSTALIRLRRLRRTFCGAIIEYSRRWRRCLGHFDATSVVVCQLIAC